MNVHQVVPRISEEASGPSYSVPALCQALSRKAVDVTLHVLDEAHQTIPGTTVTAYPSWQFARRLGVSPQMCRGLQLAAQQADILHNHSLWMMPNIYPAWASKDTNARLVVAPRGTLEPWSLRHSRWRKKVMWAAMQKSAVEQADCLHVTANSELDSVRALGLKMPAAVIPNGVDIPKQIPSASATGPRRLLYVGRIHPKKGLDHLITAWAKIHAQFPDWELRIIGRDQSGQLNRLKQLAEAQRADRISFPGPKYGPDKAAEYQQADLFVLPTHSENFGLVVAESLAHGTPVICTNGAPWPQLQSRGCGWWIDIGVDPLAEALRTGLGESRAALEARGMRGREWMKEDFSWAAVADKTRHLYEWLLGDAARPDFVDTVRRAA